MGCGENRCPLLVLKVEEGAASEEYGHPVEAGKGKDMGSSVAPLEKGAALLAP